MRVRPFIAGLLILAAAGFAGCSDDDNNNPTTPALTAAITAPATTTTGAVVTLIATANPAGAGQTYAWTASGGILSAANNDTTKWTAPDDDGTYEIVVIVGDGTNSATTKKSIVASNYVAAVDPHYVGDATCNACHSGIHENWAATGHAGALGTLAAEGMDGNPVCLGCHTVGFTTSIANGGYDEQWVPRLANVQCESCHGPASAHAGDPEHVKPIRNIQGELCASCHNGAHHPTGDEWAASGHATILEDPDLAEVAMEGGSSGCNKCHNGLRAMIYLNDPVPPYEGNFDFSVVPDSSMNISCPVCHDPHGNDNRANLRNAVLDVAIPEGSHPEAGAGRLCIACHNGRRTPTNIDPANQRANRPARPPPQRPGGHARRVRAPTTPSTRTSRLPRANTSGSRTAASAATTTTIPPDGVAAYTGHEFTPKVEACQPCHGTLESFERCHGEGRLRRRRLGRGRSG